MEAATPAGEFQLHSVVVMPCLEAAFMRGLFRIDVQQHPDAPGPPGYIAHLYLVDPETRTLRPLMLDDRSPAVIYGASEPLAVNSALTYLAETFGSFAENAHGCEPPDLPLGAPLQVSGREPDRP